MGVKKNIQEDLKRFQEGAMEYEEGIEFIQELIDTGEIKNLPSFFKRAAYDFVNTGLCTYEK